MPLSFAKTLSNRLIVYSYTGYLAKLMRSSLFRLISKVKICLIKLITALFY